MNKRIIAAKVGMNPCAFKMEPLETIKAYHFTKAENAALKEVLRELKEEIDGIL